MNASESQFILVGPNADDIRRRFGLKRLVAKGSSAELYREKSGWLYRLSRDAGSHNLLVRGSHSGLSFPRLDRDLQIVGVCDEYSVDRYWLGVFEECRPISRDGDHQLVGFIALMDELKDRLADVLSEIEQRQVASRFIDSHRHTLNHVGLFETLRFVADFAVRFDLDIDADITNFMVNEAGQTVVTDAVYGADPSPFI